MRCAGAADGWRDRPGQSRPCLPGAASQAYPNPGSTPVSNGGDYETWQMFLRQGQRAEPPAAVGSGVHRLRGGRAAGPGGHGQHCARTLGGTLNQSQGGIHICGAMKIGSGATGEALPPVPGGWSSAATFTQWPGARASFRRFSPDRFQEVPLPTSSKTCSQSAKTHRCVLRLLASAPLAPGSGMTAQY